LAGLEGPGRAWKLETEFDLFPARVLTRAVGFAASRGAIASVHVMKSAALKPDD
jgi:hypothetical protein